MNALYYYIFILIIHPYLSLWWKSFERIGQPVWKALIPVVNYYFVFKLGAKKPWWSLLLLFPGIHIFMWMVANVSYIRRFGFFTLGDTLQGIFFPYLILWKIANDPKLHTLPETNWANPKEVYARTAGDHAVLFLTLPVLGHAIAAVLSFRPNKPGKKSKWKEWGDSLLFALIAASIIRTYVFEPFQIPTGSMEKTLLVGDFLFVNKLAYGPKVPNTPLSFPLAHNTIPWLNIKSYSTIETCNYMRLPGFSKLERYDVVVFNYPSGDTAIYDPRIPDGLMGHDYHGVLISEAQHLFVESCIGKSNDYTRLKDSINNFYAGRNDIDPRDLNAFADEQARRLSTGPILQQYGKEFLRDIEKWKAKARYQMEVEKVTYSRGNNPESDEKGIHHYGLIYRPVDKRENYIKRCVGTPGDVLEIKRSVLYVNGKKATIYPNVNMRYFVSNIPNIASVLDSAKMYDDYDLLPITIYNSNGDYQYTSESSMMIHLIGSAKRRLMAAYPKANFVLQIEDQYSDDPKRQAGILDMINNLQMFPKDPTVNNTMTDYTKFWVPKKGATIKLTKENIIWYKRVITAYEGHTLTETANGVLIDGKKASTYTFAMDYYWMMGDNRYNSADSRVWGFVPEDHIVGRASIVWFSKSAFTGIRTDRILKAIH